MAKLLNFSLFIKFPNTFVSPHSASFPAAKPPEASATWGFLSNEKLVFRLVCTYRDWLITNKRNGINSLSAFQFRTASAQTQARLRLKRSCPVMYASHSFRVRKEMEGTATNRRHSPWGFHIHHRGPDGPRFFSP